MRDLNSFEIASDSEEILDEIVIAPSNSEFRHYLHPSMSSPITFYDNNTQSDESMPSTSTNTKIITNTNENNINLVNNPISIVNAIPCGTFTNQLTTDLCSTSKESNSKSRRMEYSRGMKTCSSSGSCNPSQDSAFGSMTEGDLSVASSSMRMSSFQSMSSPIDESVEDSITGLPGPSLTSSLSRGSTTSNNESMDASDYYSLQTALSTSDFNLSKKKSASFGTTNNLPIEPPTILVNDRNSIYTTTSPSKTMQIFSQKYRVSSFEDMSAKRNFLRNVHKQNFRSLEEERRIESAFVPVSNHAALHQRSFDMNSRSTINNTEKFKKLTHVSFASKISTTRERHTIWKNSILARKNNLIKSNESLHDYAISVCSTSNGKVSQSEYFADTKLGKRVCSTNELNSTCRTEGDTRFSTLSENLKYCSRKSSSERYLLNLTMLRQSTIVSDYEECDEDESQDKIQHSDDACSNSSSSGCGITSITCASSTTNTKTENNSTDSSPSHRSMCKIIGGIEGERHTEEKIPLLDSMEMSPISPVETDEML